MHRAPTGARAPSPPVMTTAAAPDRKGALARGLVTAAVLLVVWDGAVRLFAIPHYALPGPLAVFATLWRLHAEILPHAIVTFAQIGIGFALGAAAGMAGALAVAATPAGRRWLLPLFVASQAIPVFAIAPLLVIWFGFGMASKIVMAGLIIFFPVAGAFFDGLRRTDPGLLDLARLHGASGARTLALIRVPAAVPALGTGLRAAAAAAPIGAVVGEWVGAASGLGFLMLQANARMQTDVVFAALLLLVAGALALWFAVDAILTRLLHWAPETLARPSTAAPEDRT